MALREEEPKLPRKYLLQKGIPLFLLAVLVSIIFHFLTHALFGSIIGKSNLDIAGSTEFVTNYHPVAAAAGTIVTLIVAFVSFWYFLHNPQNLFAASMAFVNASMRLTEIVTVFIQMLIYKKTTVIADESIWLSLIHFNNPTPIIVLLCFLSLVIIFLTIIIVHDSRCIPYKWGIALILFILLIPLENFIWTLLRLLVA
ncbi:MAG: hypothetical protein HZB59_00305 [Ignavibacteriales bacterium]|nr:hypothetical protein [Ignavibacteriales bacterium]